ncbi:hypothetical protein BGW39_003145 [Mortierella sp. 14UC]|nr:hypothetical protein BGW39_003145 [Mortierella sp. 14UC]
MGSPIENIDEARQRLNLASVALQPRIDNFLSADQGFEYFAAFEHKVTPASDQNSPSVRLSLLILYHDYRTAMWNECSRLFKSNILLLLTRYKGNDLPGLVSFTTFRAVIRYCMEGWKSITNEHVMKMHKYLSQALLSFIVHTADVCSRDVFIRIFGRFSRTQTLSIKSIIDDIFEDESTPFTLSSHYQDVLYKEQSKNSQTFSRPEAAFVVDVNKESVHLGPPSSAGSLLPSQTETTVPQQPLQEDRGPHCSQDSMHKRFGKHLDGKGMGTELMPCLIAYLTTARERIVDKVIMQTIERYMVKRINDYFTMLIMVSDGELGCMLESSTLKRRRQELETKITDFEGILEAL